jgi:uncharacterized protein (DUF2461 family)
MAKKLSAKKQRKLARKNRKALVRGAEAAVAMMASFAAGAITMASRDKLAHLAQRVVNEANNWPATLKTTLRAWLLEADDKAKLDGRAPRPFGHANARAS